MAEKEKCFSEDELSAELMAQSGKTLNNFIGKFNAAFDAGISRVGDFTRGNAVDKATYEVISFIEDNL